MKMHRTLMALVVIAVAVHTTPTSCAWAAQPVDLAEMLPDDTIIVVRATELHKHWQQMVNSPVGRKIRTSTLPEIAEGIQDFELGIKRIEVEAGVNVEEMFKAFLGHDMMLAMLEDESGLFLTRSADPDQLRLCCDEIGALEQEIGNIHEEHTVSYHGIEITSAQVIEPQAPGMPPKERHHALMDDALIGSRSLETLKRVIDVFQRRRPSLASTAEYQEAAKHFTKGALGHAYFNTDRIAEVLDLESLLNGRLRNPLMRLWGQEIRDVLPMTRYLVANLAVNKDRMIVSTKLAYDEEKVPPEMQALRPTPNSTLDILDLVPESSVFAVGNRVNKLAFWRFTIDSVRKTNPLLAKLLGRRARQVGNSVGGMNFERDILSKIGDQAALVVSPGDDNTVPAVTLVVELSDGKAIPDALRIWLGSLATISQLDAEKKKQEPKAIFTRSRYKEIEVATLVLTEPKFQGKFSPTLLVLDRFMIVSSLPCAAHAIVDRYREQQSYQPGTSIGGTPATRGHVNMELVVTLLRRHREFLVQEDVRKGKTRQEAETGQDKGAFLLGCLDRIDFAATHSPGYVNREFLIRFAQQ